MEICSRRFELVECEMVKEFLTNKNKILIFLSLLAESSVIKQRRKPNTIIQIIIIVGIHLLAHCPL